MKPDPFQKVLAVALAASLGGLPSAQAVTVGSTSGHAAVSTTGQASYTIPIQVPPAPLGSEPRLALVYNSEGGNGILGKGWSLQGISEITRVPATFSQDGYTKGVTLTTADKYALDGQRLKTINGGSEFRTEVDTLAKVTLAGTFTVVTADGLTKNFTTVPADGVAGVTLKWVESQATDRGGNAVSYSYYGSGAPYGSSVKLPNQISYANGTISFTYEARADHVDNYLAGADVRLDERLHSISISSSGGSWYSYTFTYSYSDVTGESVLEGIQDSRFASQVALAWPAADDVAGDAFPANVSSSVTSIPGQWSMDSFANPPQDITHWPAGSDGGVRFLDLNGDGYDDILYSSGTTRKAYINTRVRDGSASQWVETPAYAPPVAFYYEAPVVSAAGIGLGTGGEVPTGVQFVDLNGDGLVDILYGQAGDHRAYLNTRTGWVSTPAYALSQDFYITFNGDLTVDNGVRLVDLNGDGLPDYIVCRDGATTEVHMNTGSGWGPNIAPTYAPSRPIAILENGTFVDNGIRFIDVNGDGLPDELIGTEIPGGTYVLEAHLNNGNGFNSFSTAAYAPMQPFSLTINSGATRVDGGVEFADLNGDGLLDQIIGTYISPQRAMKVAYLNTGAGWTANRPEYAPRQYLTYVYNGYLCDGGVRFEDVNGDGLLDYVYASGNTFQNGRATYINTGVGWTAASSTAYTPGVDFVYWASGQDGVDKGARFIDMTGDGHVALVSGFGGTRAAYRNTAHAPNLLASAQNEFGMRAEFTYHQLTEGLYYTEATAPVAFPIRNYVSPMYVTSKLGQSNGVGGINAVDYTYANARVDAHGRGFLGFEFFDSYDEVTGYSTQDDVSQAFPWIGMSISSVTNYGASLVSQTTDTLAARSLNSGASTFPYFSSSIVINNKDATKVTTTIPTTGVDDYGNITQKIVAYDGAGQVQTDNVFTNNIGTWVIGELNQRCQLRLCQIQGGHHRLQQARHRGLL